MTSSGSHAGTGHTPGPWGYWPHYSGEAGKFVVGPDNFETVASVRLGSDDVPGNCEANARLIAASPSLFAFVRRVALTLTSDEGFDGDEDATLDAIVTEARAAIALTEGAKP